MTSEFRFSAYFYGLPVQKNSSKKETLSLMTSTFLLGVASLILLIIFFAVNSGLAPSSEILGETFPANPMPMSVPSCSEKCISNFELNAKSSKSCDEKCALAIEYVRLKVNHLCKDIPRAPLCSLRSRCKNGECSLFSVWGGLCSAETGVRYGRACATYSNICSDNSHVVDCIQNKPLKFANSLDIQSAAFSLCQSMESMPGCAACLTPEICTHIGIEELLEMCETMEMEVCVAFKTKMCKLYPAFSVFGCDASTPSVGMKMYFHGGVHEYVLLPSLVTSSPGGYAVVCVCIVLCGVLSAGLKGKRHLLYLSWPPLPLSVDKRGLGAFGSLSILFSPCSNDEEKSIMNALMGRNLKRMGYSFLIMLVDYSLMLLAMSFNLGFFLSVIAGASFGQLLFGHWTSNDFSRGFDGK